MAKLKNKNSTFTKEKPYALTYFNRTLVLSCALALFACASVQSRRLKALAQIDPSLAQKHKGKEAPAYTRHNNKNYIWDTERLRYRVTSVKEKRSQKAPPKEIAKSPAPFSQAPGPQKKSRPRLPKNTKMERRLLFFGITTKAIFGIQSACNIEIRA